MAHQRPSSHFGKMEYQQRGWGVRHHQQGRIENRQPANVFQEDTNRLGSLLEMERARWFEENQKVAALEKELEDTKLEVKRQKNLKEMYINEGKETKRKLMRLEKFSNPETLNPAIIASKVHSDMKYKKKKLLQQDFEQLKVAHVVNEQLLVAEKEKNNTLQQELDKVKLSYEQLRSKREADNAGVKLQVDMQKVYEDKIKQDETLIENLRAEKEDLFQTMSYEMAVLQEKKKCLKSEMEQLKVSYQELSLKYETEVSALRQQAEALQHEMNREKEAHSERAKNDLQLINDLKAEKDRLHQKIQQEVGFLQQQSVENTKRVQRELEQVMISYQELKTRYDLDVSAHRQQEEVFEQELDQQIKARCNVNEQLFVAEIQAEKEKNNTLQQELDKLKLSYEQLRSKLEADNAGVKLQVDMQKVYEDKIKSEMEQLKVSYQELSLKYETEVFALRQQAEALQHEMNREKEAHLQVYEDKIKQDETLIENLRAEKDDLFQTMSYEMAVLQEKKKCLKSEMEQLKVSYQELSLKYETEVSAHRQQAEVFEQELDQQIKAHPQKIRDNPKFIDQLGAEEDALHQQVTVLQQQFSGCDVNYKTEVENPKAELQDRDDLGPPKSKRARRQVPSCQNESIGDPASMDLDHLLEEILSEPVEYPEASPMELDNFEEEMLRESSILDSEPMKVTELSEETLPENQKSQDPEPTQVGASQNNPSVWKRIRHILGLTKPKKWKKSKNTST